MNIIFVDTPAGQMAVAEEGGNITRLFLRASDAPANVARAETPALTKAARQLAEYFEGKRKEFDLPLAPQGTPFQLKVWRALCSIPYGKTASYADIAAKIKNPKACRAVGMANNKNPLSIFIPCHRVVGANGSLTGYGGGLPLKKKLLDLEQKYK